MNLENLVEQLMDKQKSMRDEQKRQCNMICQLGNEQDDMQRLLQQFMVQQTQMCVAINMAIHAVDATGRVHMMTMGFAGSFEVGIIFLTMPRFLLLQFGSNSMQDSKHSSWEIQQTTRFCVIT
jgi:hypothetical protein